MTGSGLSMVDWKPIMGVLPPLNQIAWMEAFEKYQQFPEYKIVNGEFSLSDFRFIFLMEYFHRLFGRLIGIVFFVPFVIFLSRGVVPARLKTRLWLLFILGACQGMLGWYMVMSGLVDNPHVSQYRLTAHLLVAVVIYAWMVRLISGLLDKEKEGSVFLEMRVPDFAWHAMALFCLLILMIGTGGLVAGTRAGFIYNTWPKMGQDWMPDMLWSLLPWWRNLFENPIAIQFFHRWLAIIVLCSVLGFAIQVFRLDPRVWVRRLAIVAIVFVLVQVTLGIWTLLLKVPVALGVAHQGVALLLLGAVTAILSSYLPGNLHGRQG